MKIADLVTEMRMNKMPLLLNMLKKEEFGYLRQYLLTDGICQQQSQTMWSSQMARITVWLKQFY